MFWVLKKTVSLRRFFWLPTTYVFVEKQEKWFFVTLSLKAWAPILVCTFTVHILHNLAFSWYSSYTSCSVMRICYILHGKHNLIRATLFSKGGIWASTWEKLSSGFPTRSYANLPAQLQRLAKIEKFLAKVEEIPLQAFTRFDMLLYNKGITKADQTACMPVCPFVVKKTLKDRYSHAEAHIIMKNLCTQSCIRLYMVPNWQAYTCIA